MTTSVNPFDGIDEKLQRAHDNILNLDREIKIFYKKYASRMRKKDDFDGMMKAVRDFRQQAIPLRFSVLAGEVIHHFRSCFDHIAWQLSSSEERRDHPLRIEFPIFEKTPVEKDEISSYNRKIKGILNLDARKTIEQLQPYNGVNGSNFLIWVIHDMDRKDKHRELAIMAHIVKTGMSEKFFSTISPYVERDIPMPLHLAREARDKMNLSPTVAFQDFGKPQNLHPVIDGLFKLETFTRSGVRLFEKYL